MKLTAKVLIVPVLATIFFLLGADVLTYRHVKAVLEEDMSRRAGMFRDVFVEIWRKHGPTPALDLLRIYNDGNEIDVKINLVALDVTIEGPPYTVPTINRERLVRLLSQPGLQLEPFDHYESSQRFRLVYAEVDFETPGIEALEFSELWVRPRKHLMGIAAEATILSGVVLLLGGAFIIVFGTQMVGIPLQKLIEKTRRVGRGDLSGPIDIRRRGELDELATSINSMCEQIAESEQRLREESEARAVTTEQLRHAERLHTVGELASGMAHELGTPLSVVSGRAGLIASGKLSEDEIKKSADIIKAETDRITTIIRQLLDFARRTTPKKMPTDLRTVVKQLFELLDPLAERRNYELHVADEPDAVMAPIDVGQIQQVLTNLVVNAAQSMPDGGKIEIGFRRQHLRPPKGHGHGVEDFVCVYVRDAGTGIPPDVMKNIFDPFFTTKPRGQGTGLGLSISYGIVEEHGGWIAVQSEPNQGSCFSIYLPAEGELCPDES